MAMLWCKIRWVWLPLGLAHSGEGQKALERWAWAKGYATREERAGPITVAPEAPEDEPACWEALEALEASNAIMVHIDRFIR